MSIFGYFDWVKRLLDHPESNREVIRRKRFENVMGRARAIAKADPLGLSSMVRLIARPLQARAMVSVAYQTRHGARGAFDPSNLIGSLCAHVTPDGKTISDLIEAKAERYRLILGRDPVLAVPWNEDRLKNALAHIGYARTLGKWTEDTGNHAVSLWLPFGIAFVSGGNHSLAAGIVNAEGTVVTREVVDCSPLYEHVRYDGVGMIRIHDGVKLCEPIEEEFGILFEIGRLMVEHGVCYDIPPAANNQNDSQKEDFMYYRVFFDNKDTGYTLSDSGATRMLRQAGIPPESDQARSILVKSEPFTITRHGDERQVRLEYYVRRPLNDDLKNVTLPSVSFYGDD